jgi:ABC-2 type transport system ATP-binding protein
MALLEVDSLQKTYRSGSTETHAVSGISFTIDEGEVLGFLGPNGAGKTTTIKMIAGLIRPDAGTTRIAGLDPHRGPAALRQVGAVLEGNRNVYWRLTPLENLEYFGVLKGMPAAQARRTGAELLDRFGLKDKREVPVQRLSRGMQQKLSIAVALVNNPRLLLLDEPTLGLDVEAAETVKQLLRERIRQGRAVLLTSHQLGVVEEIADRVAILRQGRIAVQEKTKALLDRFSGESYTIEVEGAVDPERRKRLESCGAWLGDTGIGYLGTAEGLYAVLGVLSPLPVRRVVRDRADLTGVFLKLVRENADA